MTITVVLFSSIIAMVDQFPPRRQCVHGFHRDDRTLDGSWSNGASIMRRTPGGQVMTGDWTLIVLTIDSQTLPCEPRGL